MGWPQDRSGICDHWLDFQKMLEDEWRPFLQMVIKFQVDSTLFHTGEAVANISGKVGKEKEETVSVTIETVTVTIYGICIYTMLMH